MKKNIIQALLSVALPLTFAVGCAHTQQQEAGTTPRAFDSSLGQQPQGDQLQQMSMVENEAITEVYYQLARQNHDPSAALYPPTPLYPTRNLAPIPGTQNQKQQSEAAANTRARAALTPTSARPVSRVYPYHPKKTLSPYSIAVSVTVDEGSKGLVGLSGVMPNDYERQRLHNRIAKIPNLSENQRNYF